MGGFISVETNPIHNRLSFYTPHSVIYGKIAYQSKFYICETNFSSMLVLFFKETFFFIRQAFKLFGASFPHDTPKQRAWHHCGSINIYTQKIQTLGQYRIL